jgi:hypothetical protein
VEINLSSTFWSLTTKPRSSLVSALVFILVLATWGRAAPFSAAASAPESLRLLVPEGGWCWFQDERAIVVGSTVVLGSVKSPTGDIDAHAWDPRTGAVRTFTLDPRHESDDHNVPALLALPDGRILAGWGNHGRVQPKEDNQRLWWRHTVRPGDFSAWEPTASLPHSAGGTYTNRFRLNAEHGRIYNFSRSVAFNPNYTVSDDEGRTFRYGGRLLSWPQPAADDPKSTRATGGGRPYVKYASNERDTVHVLATEDHPRAYRTAFITGSSAEDPGSPATVRWRAR